MLFWSALGELALLAKKARVASADIRTVEIAAAIVYECRK